MKMTAFIPPQPTMYGSIPSAQDSLNSVALRYFQFVDPSQLEQLNAFLENLEKVRIALFIHRESPIALKILKKLWKHHRADEPEEMKRAILEAENILRECGQIEEYTARSRPRTNQHAVLCKGVTSTRAHACAVINRDDHFLSLFFLCPLRSLKRSNDIPTISAKNRSLG